MRGIPPPARSTRRLSEGAFSRLFPFLAVWRYYSPNSGKKQEKYQSAEKRIFDGLEKRIFDGLQMEG